jgi:activator of HSP90 ATPase
MQHQKDKPFNPERRSVLQRVALFSAALAAAPQLLSQQQAAVSEPSTRANRKRTALHIEMHFPASSAHIYASLLDPRQFADLTGAPAEIEPKEGGSFSLFSGQITGRTIELVPDQRVVQAWRSPQWEPGFFSVVRFVVQPTGSATTLVLDHTGFPEGHYDSLLAGWHSHYEVALKKIPA